MPRNKKNKLSLLIFLIALSIAALLSLFVWWKIASSPVDKNSQVDHIFVIPKGQAIDIMGKRLKEKNLIKSRAAFKIMVITNKLSTKIQAGDFRLRASMDLSTLTNELTSGTLDIWVTLLEGWRKEEMADKIEKEFLTRSAEFDKKAFLQSTKNSEGYLFPDTYLLPRGASAQTIVTLLEDTFDSKVDFKSNNTSLTPKQVVILASIVEREVNTDKDRPIVAGILIKRLDNDWPLQVDASIQYAVGTRNCTGKTGCNWWKQNLTRADIDRKSVFNTYLNQGLPKAPIANPGIDSINAVLNPKSSSNWFYISDPKGNMHYGKTIEEHNSNIARYLQK